MDSNFLQYELVRFSNYSLTLARVIYVIVLALAVVVFLQFIRKVLFKYSRFSESQQNTFYTIIKYFIIVIFISSALKLLGIDISVLIAGSAALFVGIGLGLQSIFNDFLSGLILLIDGSIKVGNVIQVGDKRVEVLAIRLRTSLVKTREEHEIIIPNSFFTKNEIINWSTQRNINRHYVELKVLASDVEKAIDMMQRIALTHPKVAKTPAPYARIERFYDHAVELRILFWSEEVLAVGRLLGEIRLMILKSFRENGIESPVPGIRVSGSTNPPQH
ncbi:MAG TPA: mechanosensitive ion channel domain-containing protein [Bacteroidia bacterium]|nr:mechanosensitive ion channel domain-containing protein [Bacteroidia bacterium]